MSEETLEMVETILSAISDCVKNRCYPKGSVMHIRRIQLLVRDDLVLIDKLLLEDETRVGEEKKR